MGLSLMGVVMLAGSFSLGAIVQAQERVWFCVPQFLGLVVFSEWRQVQPLQLLGGAALILAGSLLVSGA